MDPSAIRWRDEVMQVMYWMHNEGFGTEITLQDIQRFLEADRDVLLRTIQQLVEVGCVQALSPESYTLTTEGLREGKRRFVDEFEPMLKHGHGECNDPDCECHQAERPEDTCLAKNSQS